MPDLRLRVQPFDQLGGGQEYGGWKAVRVCRSIEAVAGSFELAVSDRWNGQTQPWPISAEDECWVVIDGVPVITGYVDRRSHSYGPEDHTLSVSGRDKTGLLVDCSAVLPKWEFLWVSPSTLAHRLCDPFGIAVTVQAGLSLPVAAKLTIDPGDTAFDALERACRVAGCLPVSDGAGGLLLTRAGSSRCATALVEGQNILQASASYDATGRYRRYVVNGQHPGTAEFAGDAAATVRGEASDPNVKRSSRVLMVRAENSITPDLAKKRAQWEAKVRAARGDSITVTVQGWTQGDGKLWPLNAIVTMKSPLLGIDGDLLITQATHSLDEHRGTTTELVLRRPDAFLPEPTVPKALYQEIAKGV